MPRIQILDDRLVSQIAAGEVVERPASVVKELLENALDAGAGEVRIELAGGGKRRIRVEDDGCGMGRDDALLAFDRHATSKISRFEDLEQVASLGFRGEALSSIAAVARVELTTAEQPGDGQRVRVEGGRIRSVEPVAHPVGTTVVVESLFFNVPARRRFLKSPRTELRRAAEVVQGYALARPEVRLSVLHDGRALLESAAGGEGPEAVRRCVSGLFGEHLAGRLTEIAGAAGEGGRVWGLVGDPGTARGRRLFTFVNRRLLRDRALTATFYRAVREEWRSEEFPALFLFVDLPPSQVDVNVHPQKSEVRFRDPGAFDGISLALRRSLRRALGEEEAPLRRPGAGLPAPLAWQGGDGRGPSAPAGAAPGEVREGGPPERPPGAPRLAEAAYAPLERAPIPLSGRDGETRPFRLLGQYKGTLILLQGPDGLYLVDQHVAHERVLYERLRRELERERPASQQLLEPVLLELAPTEAMRLAELADELSALGFALSELSGRTLALTAAPPVVSSREAERLLVGLAGDGEAEAGAAGLRRRLLDALAASLSCRSAVKMHEPLSAAEMEALVGELFAADQPYACPHGRPIVLKMSDADLERRFGRR